MLPSHRIRGPPTTGFQDNSPQKSCMHHLCLRETCFQNSTVLSTIYSISLNVLRPSSSLYMFLSSEDETAGTKRSLHKFPSTKLNDLIENSLNK
jgi:hypothetical protein